MQPVVNTVVKPVWQPSKCLYTRYNRLSNRFDNRLYRVYKHSAGCQTRLTSGCIVYTAGCQTGLYNRFDNRVQQTVCSFNTVVKPCLSNRLYNPVWQLVERTVLFVQHVLLTTGCIVYTNIQPVVKPVWQPVGCLFTQYSRLSDQLYNRFNNRLYRVNGV